ncbi:alpha/beta fold hydrolase [Sphingomonas sp. AR_OL41]|uniref:alpha/beta hydrolase n=1 Tax=Sphingomonas sp. AR_OL41 TaxID=3042729 RepID=UPI00247FC35D|nr:alpha/beta hydrolase [Sphingomonas sp. AR_OL41]MDH7975673.1 alpha/beta fold hydrolase [Sphingomonas sp. AR_OL41]
MPSTTSSAGSISLRDSIVGGVLRNPAVEPVDLLIDRDRILLLIHGFNVTQADADRSYTIFERQLSDDVRNRIVRLYWPGDSSTKADSRTGQQGALSKYLSAASYSWKPPIARQSAQKLRDLLNATFISRANSGRNRPLEICVVAHSLGCRLTLEMLERVLVSVGRDAELPLTVLMAAAVPEYMVKGTDSLASVVSQLPELWVLYSRSDTVLRRFFRPGQVFERASFPSFNLSARRALGRRGMAATDRIKVLQGEWDHSDYWVDRDVARAVDTALSDAPKTTAPFETLTRTVWERSVQARAAERRVINEIPSAW